MMGREVRRLNWVTSNPCISTKRDGAASLVRYVEAVLHRARWQLGIKKVLRRLSSPAMVQLSRDYVK